MEDIFKSFSPSIPFLIFKQIKELISKFCKTQVSFESKIKNSEDKITTFNTHLTSSTLPDHLQKQFSKIVSADVDPLQTSALYSSVLKIEISKVDVKIKKLKADLLAAEQDFQKQLTEMLRISNFRPLPTDGAPWQDFLNLHFWDLLKALKASISLHLYVQHTKNLKKKEKKKEKFDKMKAQKNEPILVTENSLHLLATKLSKVSVTKSKHLQKKKTTDKNKSPGKGRRPSKSGGGAKKVTIRKAGGPSSRNNQS